MGALLLATHSTGSQAQVLHEFVPDVDSNEALATLARTSGGPPLVSYRGELVGPPDTTVAPPLSMIASSGDGRGQERPGRRSAAFRPDRLTALESTVEYHACFSPTIAPFKRVTALDAVAFGKDGRTPVLGVWQPRSDSVAVTAQHSDQSDSARDRFWGYVELDLREGRRTPLPSVAPGSHLLLLRAEPNVALQVSKDGADNFFVSVAGALPRNKKVRLSFLTDAPQGYFAQPVPQVPVNALAVECRPMPAGIRRRALRLASELGVHASSSLPEALAKLTAHFRAFEESEEPPRDSGDILADLVRSKKGICRHRSYGFTILAQALGVPARFVQNEAHSWVEVKLFGAGWMRIDLGGAAHGLNATGAATRPVYIPENPDPLPRPEAYERAYSLLAGNVRGLRGSLSRPVGASQARWLARATTGSPGGRLAPFLGMPTQGADPAAGSVDTGRERLTVRLSKHRYSVVRGEMLAVRGLVLGPTGQGVAGLRVEVSLAAVDQSRTLLLGVTLTGPGGDFGRSFGVPADLKPGDYRLVVIAPDTPRYAPAMAY